jgi:alkanesulfonate monooxygenase SsuD/methylene tetrahydromethanopterin reductase-like flavin-dependent oxidoreductase (luciferase family)
MGQLGVSIPVRTAAIDRIPELAALGDRAGFDAVYTYELYRDPFAMLGASARTTERARLGTCVTAAFYRSPFVMANQAADVDELSGGRMIVGLGTGVPEFMRAFHSTGPANSLQRIREYIRCLRLSWQYLATGEPETFTGEHYRFEPRIPITLFSHGPRMTQLAAEVADGWTSTMTSPRWITEKVIPELEKGARRGGRDLGDLTLSQLAITSVHPDREIAYRRAKIHIGFYCMHPLIRGVVGFEGLEKERAWVEEQVAARGFDALTDTPDALVDALCIAGTPEEARQKLAVWREATPNIIFHTPYVPPLTAEESEDAYLNILDTFGDPTTVAGRPGSGIPGGTPA